MDEQAVSPIDLYEHSYHIDFSAKAGSYVDTFMNIIRWQNADRLFSKLTNEAGG
jgi:Fe-Mn family superoxide dismutase